MWERILKWPSLSLSFEILENLMSCLPKECFFSQFLRALVSFVVYQISLKEKLVLTCFSFNAWPWATTDKDRKALEKLTISMQTRQNRIERLGPVSSSAFWAKGRFLFFLSFCFLDARRQGESVVALSSLAFCDGANSVCVRRLPAVQALYCDFEISSVCGFSVVLIAGDLRVVLKPEGRQKHSGGEFLSAGEGLL